MSLKELRDRESKTGKVGFAADLVVAGKHFGLRIGTIYRNGFEIGIDDPN